jgi:hypothetical protein
LVVLEYWWLSGSRPGCQFFARNWVSRQLSCPLTERCGGWFHVRSHHGRFIDSLSQFFIHCVDIN